MATLRRQTLRVDELPEEHREWMEPVLRAFNNLSTDAAAAINGGLTLAGNGQAFFKTLDIDLRKVAYPVQFLNELPNGATPAGLTIVGASKNGVPVGLSGCPAWQVNGSQIAIYDVPGLATDAPYKVTFLVHGG